jgi:hypothetical protein
MLDKNFRGYVEKFGDPLFIESRSRRLSFIGFLLRRFQCPTPCPRPTF